MFAPRGTGRDRLFESTFLRATARSCGWRVYHVEEPQFYRTYAWVRTEYRDETTFVLLHHEGGAAAFSLSDPREDPWNYPFVDRPEFVKAAAELLWPIRFLTAAELNEDVTSENRALLNSLDSLMENDIRAWNPQTVAHVVFNFWD